MKDKRSLGYKVCYKEKGMKRYDRYFITYTLKQARQARTSYMRYPPKSRKDNHMIDNAKWVIIPIRHSEVKDGIWHEIPFPEERAFFFYKTKFNLKGAIKWSLI